METSIIVSHKKEKDWNKLIVKQIKVNDYVVCNKTKVHNSSVRKYNLLFSSVFYIYISLSAGK